MENLETRIYSCTVQKATYAIFSLGDLQGTSSSSSSSLSSPSSATSWEMLRVELVNMSGTGRMLGLLEFLRWLIISGLKRFGLSPLGMSRWFPVTETSKVTEPGEESFRHWRESPKVALSEKVAGNVLVFLVRSSFFQVDFRVQSSLKVLNT